MNKDGTLTISDWNKGLASHPIYGFGVLKNVEVFENKGLAKIKNQISDRNSETPITLNTLAIAEVYDKYGNTYNLTNSGGNGVFYKNGDVYAIGRTNPWDMVYYKDYVFIRHAGDISAYGPVNDGPQMFQSIYSSLDTNYAGKIIIGQDGYLYTTNGNAVAKIDVTSSGTSGVAPSLTVTPIALDLPDGRYATTIEEYGANLIIGTSAGANYAERKNYPNARLYPWNRKSGILGDPGLADLPVIFNENGINCVYQHANKLYVSAGTRGNIYVTDSTNYVKIATIPYAATGSNIESNVYYNAMTTSSRGTLLVGVSTENGDYSKAGIYEIDINDPSYPISLMGLSSDTDGPTDIGFVKQKSFNRLHVGWKRYATAQIDFTGNDIQTGGAFIESRLYKVGDFNKKKTFSHIEFSLAEPLVSGQSIELAYRKNNRDDYTVIGEYDFATLGAVTSFEDIAGISNAEYVQIRATLNQTSTITSSTNIYLVSIKLR